MMIDLKSNCVHLDKGDGVNLVDEANAKRWLATTWGTMCLCHRVGGGSQLTTPTGPFAASCWLHSSSF